MYAELLWSRVAQNQITTSTSVDDHIYYKGAVGLTSFGIINDLTGSNHKPIYATFEV